jgi:predicted RNase H-related nuclease YkuK (DUF458 family)
VKHWSDADGNPIEDYIIKNEIINYSSRGGKLYIGADSMFYTNKCCFATVIALHDANQKIAKYYYRRLNKKSSQYKDLKIKILEEVNLAIQTADFVLNICPSAEIELHIDISTKKKNLTSKLYNTVKGWVTGLGYNLKVKPHSWASTSVADWHTK